MGRLRKQPPVLVPAGLKYCFSCHATLPLLSFATDRQQHDGKKLDCRTCDNAARAVRVQRRRERLKRQAAA